MCGIVAAVSQHGGVDVEAMAAATRCLRHRGPDAQNVWAAPDRRAGLGHARLSIIDLETGDQPIANEDERLHIVANGEFYDFERDPACARAEGPRLPHAVGQRDRAPPVRGPRRALPCTRCEGSSRSRSGTSATACSSRHAIASASSPSTTPCTTGRSTWRPRSRRSPRSACRCAGTTSRCTTSTSCRTLPIARSSRVSTSSRRRATC